MKEGHASRARTVSGATGASSRLRFPWRNSRPGFVNAQRRGNRRHKRATDTRRSTGGGTRARPQAPDVMTGSRVVLLGRFSGLLATSQAANRPRRRDPNTSPDHSIGHHRPVIASNFLGLSGHSPSKKLATEGHLRIAS
ncbi:hypothetical protein Pint_17097 [Pistacia integerrima]|uniref:Uncharacterized protein n=1 Tax=Pistacia integerrima TaxID=434235 RepID=A0ACC0YW42_9ROSI|nr:hypothetical protein Pint_17097 [Pistacia integerrima]